MQRKHNYVQNTKCKKNSTHFSTFTRCISSKTEIRGFVKYTRRYFVMKMVLQEVSQQKFKVKVILFRFIRVIIEQKNRAKN